MLYILLHFWLVLHIWGGILPELRFERVSHKLFQNGLSLLGTSIIRSKAMGNIQSHFKCIFWYILPGSSLLWVIFSVFPVDWGLQDACNFHLICSVCPTFWEISKVNDAPLLFWIPWGSPNLGVICLSSFATSVNFLVLEGYASTHLEKVSTKTNKNLKFPVVLGTCVKSTCQSFSGHNSLYCIPFFTGVCSVLGLFLAHIWQAWIILWTVLCKWVPFKCGLMRSSKHPFHNGSLHVGVWGWDGIH